MENPLQLSFVNFKKDAYIIVEGKQNAERFFIIRAGKVRISKEVEVVEEEGGNILGPGDFFGVVSTMSSHSHIETAQAVVGGKAFATDPTFIEAPLPPPPWPRRPRWRRLTNPSTRCRWCWAPPSRGARVARSGQTWCASVPMAASTSSCIRAPRW